MAPSKAASGLIFEEPVRRAGPLLSGQKPIWFERLEPIMEFPGEWVRAHEYPAPGTARLVATYLRRNDTKCRRPEGNWEFATRTVDGLGVIYAKYNGPA